MALRIYRSVPSVVDSNKGPLPEDILRNLIDIDEGLHHQGVGTDSTEDLPHHDHPVPEIESSHQCHLIETPLRMLPAMPK